MPSKKNKKIIKTDVEPDIESDDASEIESEKELTEGEDVYSEDEESVNEQSGGEDDDVKEDDDENEEDEEAEVSDDDDVPDEAENEENDEEVGEEGDDAGGDEDRDDEDYSAESKICHAKNVKKDVVVADDEDSMVYANLQYTRVPDDERITGNELTYYEIVRIIGTRAQMLNLRAPPLIEVKDNLSPVQIAYLELLAGRTPFIIRRPLANKKYEEWRIAEMKVIHEITEEMVVPENFNKEAFLEMVEKTFPSK